MKKIVFILICSLSIASLQSCTKKDFPVPQDTSPAPPSSPSVPAPPSM